jgi:hypothetical protein
MFLGLVVVSLLAGPVAATVLFGADKGGIAPSRGWGAKLDYAQFWMGAWSERSGWGTASNGAQQIADQGVVPVVQWYYWAADISPSCVSNGCWSASAGLWKDRAHWFGDAAKLADALHAGLHGRPGVVVLESEFNKHGIQTWDPFDGMLVQQAALFRAHAPELRVVLGFGNWNPQYWTVFDQAARAADYVGFQTMRGSTRDSYASYTGAVDAISTAVQRLHADFGKPVLLYDLALSSFWEPQWAATQNQVFQQLFARLPSLEGQGLRGVILRSISDDPRMTLAEYYGWGERYMGLRHADGTWKPALSTWIHGVQAARGGAASTASAAGAPASTDTWAWQPRAQGNDWWVEVALPGAKGAHMWASVDGGAWHALPATSWGDWASSFHVPNGARVTFHAQLPDGTKVASPAYTWW